jgi:hypothetical protein
MGAPIMRLRFAAFFTPDFACHRRRRQRKIRGADAGDFGASRTLHGPPPPQLRVSDLIAAIPG